MFRIGLALWTALTAFGSRGRDGRLFRDLNPTSPIACLLEPYFRNTVMSSFRL